MTQMRPLNEVVDYLSQKHAQDQDTIANLLVLSMVPLWSILHFEDLDKTSVLWTEAVLPRIKTAYMQSQHVAAAYAANIRFASLADSEPLPINVPNVELPVGVPVERFVLPDFGSTETPPVELDPISENDVRLSLLVEGNYNIKKQMPVDEFEAMQGAQVNATGAAVRQTLKGARNVTDNVLKFDRKVLGYARFTDADPCAFCALLASRGAVYGAHSFVDSDKSFQANKQAIEVPADYLRISKVHNNCRCTLRPVYSKSQEYDADAKFYRQQWSRVYTPNKRLPADEIVKMWREQYRPFQRTQSDVASIRSALREREVALLDNGFAPDSPQVVWAKSLLA